MNAESWAVLYSVRSSPNQDFFSFYMSENNDEEIDLDSRYETCVMFIEASEVSLALKVSDGSRLQFPDHITDVFSDILHIS